jgi:hypothetical protein
MKFLSHCSFEPVNATASYNILNPRYVLEEVYCQCIELIRPPQPKMYGSANKADPEQNKLVFLTIAPPGRPIHGGSQASIRGKVGPLVTI